MLAPAKAIMWCCLTGEFVSIPSAKSLSRVRRASFPPVLRKKREGADARKASFNVASQMDLNLTRVPVNRSHSRLSSISKILLQAHHSEAGGCVFRIGLFTDLYLRARPLSI